MRYGLDIYGVVVDIKSALFKYKDIVLDLESDSEFDLSYFKDELSDIELWNELDLNIDFSTLNTEPSFYFLDSDFNLEVVKKWIKLNNIPDKPILTTEGGLVQKEAVILDSNIIFGTEEIDTYITTNVNLFKNICLLEKIDVYLYSDSMNSYFNTKKRINNINNFINEKN